MNSLYTRHFALQEFGSSEQQKLADSTVLIVGLGGLGHLAATYLATAGVGHLLLNDFDSIDASNLQRQFLYDSLDIGKNKAIVAKQKLLHLNPAIRIEAIQERLNENELLRISNNIDLILDCSDNFGTRFTVNRIAVKNKISLVSGAAIRFEGQLTTFNSDSVSPCYQCLFQESNELAEDCEGNGILAPVTGVIASAMSVEAFKSLTAIGSALIGRLHLYDAKTSAWREVRYTKDPDCEVCGT